MDPKTDWFKLLEIFASDPGQTVSPQARFVWDHPTVSANNTKDGLKLKNTSLGAIVHPLSDSSPSSSSHSTNDIKPDSIIIDINGVIVALETFASIQYRLNTLPRPLFIRFLCLNKIYDVIYWHPELSFTISPAVELAQVDSIIANGKCQAYGLGIRAGDIIIGIDNTKQVDFNDCKSIDFDSEVTLKLLGPRRVSDETYEQMRTTRNNNGNTYMNELHHLLWDTKEPLYLFEYETLNNNSNNSAGSRKGASYSFVFRGVQESTQDRMASLQAASIPTREFIDKRLNDSYATIRLVKDFIGGTSVSSSNSTTRSPRSPKNSSSPRQYTSNKTGIFDVSLRQLLFLSSTNDIHDLLPVLIMNFVTRSQSSANAYWDLNGATASEIDEVMFDSVDLVLVRCLQDPSLLSALYWQLKSMENTLRHDGQSTEVVSEILDRLIIILMNGLRTTREAKGCYDHTRFEAGDEMLVSLIRGSRLGRLANNNNNNNNNYNNNNNNNRRNKTSGNSNSNNNEIGDEESRFQTNYSIESLQYKFLTNKNINSEFGVIQATRLVSNNSGSSLSIHDESEQDIRTTPNEFGYNSTADNLNKNSSSFQSFSLSLSSELDINVGADTGMVNADYDDDINAQVWRDVASDDDDNDENKNYDRVTSSSHIDPADTLDDDFVARILRKISSDSRNGGKFESRSFSQDDRNKISENRIDESPIIPELPCVDGSGLLMLVQQTLLYNAIHHSVKDVEITIPITVDHANNVAAGAVLNDKSISEAIFEERNELLRENLAHKLSEADKYLRNATYEDIISENRGGVGLWPMLSPLEPNIRVLTGLDLENCRMLYHSPPSSLSSSSSHILGERPTNVSANGVSSYGVHGIHASAFLAFGALWKQESYDNDTQPEELCMEFVVRSTLRTDAAMLYLFRTINSRILPPTRSEGYDSTKTTSELREEIQEGDGSWWGKGCSKCVLMGPDSGLYEWTGIENGTMSLDEIIDSFSVHGENPLQLFLRATHQSKTGLFEISSEVMENFIRSCAAVGVVGYIMGINNRNTDNHILHANGACGMTQLASALQTEMDTSSYTSPLRFMYELVQAMCSSFYDNNDGNNSGTDEAAKLVYRFLHLSGRVFLSIRRNSSLLLNLVRLLTQAQDSEAISIGKSALAITQRDTLEVLRSIHERLHLDLSDIDACGALRCMLGAEVESVTTNHNNNNSYGNMNGNNDGSPSRNGNKKISPKTKNRNRSGDRDTGLEHSMTGMTIDASSSSSSNLTTDGISTGFFKWSSPTSQSRQIIGADKTVNDNSYNNYSNNHTSSYGPGIDVNSMNDRLPADLKYAQQENERLERLRESQARSKREARERLLRPTSNMNASKASLEQRRTDKIAKEELELRERQRKFNAGTKSFQVSESLLLSNKARKADRAELDKKAKAKQDQILARTSGIKKKAPVKVTSRLMRPTASQQSAAAELKRREEARLQAEQEKASAAEADRLLLEEHKNAFDHIKPKVLDYLDKEKQGKGE